MQVSYLWYGSNVPFLPFISGYSLIPVPGCPVSGANCRSGGAYHSLYLFFNVYLFTRMEDLLNKAEMQILNLFSRSGTANMAHIYFLLSCKWAFLD